MSNADWYARRLQQARAPQQAPAQPSYPPTQQPLAPGQLPPHMAPFQTPVLAPPTPQGVPQMLPGQQPQQQPQSFYSYDAATGAQVADDGTMAMLVNSASQSGGSTVVKANSTKCPNCFEDTYFRIADGGVFSKAAGGIVHAQQCASCGFPKVQAGSQGGALQTARSSGPAKAARQLPANHRVTVAVEGGGYATFDPPTGA